MIKVKNLSSVLNSQHAPVFVLNDIIMQVERGSTVGIIGESGSGKTQLMMAITGNQPLTPGVYEGTVEYEIDGIRKNYYPFFDNAINRYRIKQKNNKYLRNNSHQFSKLVKNNYKKIKKYKVGFIAQDPKINLNPYWSIELLFRQAYNKKQPEISFDDFIAKYCKQVKLNPDKIRKKYPHELSGGMAQRVMIAFILSQEPEIIIGDECTTGLDVGNQKGIINLFKNIKHNNPDVTLILISHDIGFLNLLTDELYVMFGGYIVEYIKNKSRLFDLNNDLHPYTEDLRDSLIPNRENELSRTSELTSQIKLDVKSDGCPYSHGKRCEIFQDNPSLPCQESMPPVNNISRNVDEKENAEISLDDDWVRCWGINNE